MKHFSRRLFFPLLITSALLCSACGAGSEKADVLPVDEMADVLYDYQLAQTLGANIADSLPAAVVEYRLAVFRKYGIDARKFDHSLAYYSRNAEEMKKVYARIDAKYARVSDGATSGAASGGSSTDTLSLWQRPLLVLTAEAAPHAAFRVRPKGKIAARSTLSLFFAADWLYKQGLKQGTSLLRVHYANDSTETFVNGIYSYQRDQEVRATLGSSVPVREIEIKVMQNVGWQPSPQVLTLSGMRLVAVRPYDSAR